MWNVSFRRLPTKYLDFIQISIPTQFQTCSSSHDSIEWFIFDIYVFVRLNNNKRWKQRDFQDLFLMELKKLEEDDDVSADLACKTGYNSRGNLILSNFFFSEIKNLWKHLKSVKLCKRSTLKKKGQQNFHLRFRPIMATPHTCKKQNSVYHDKILSSIWFQIHKMIMESRQIMGWKRFQSVAWLKVECSLYSEVVAQVIYLWWYFIAKSWFYFHDTCVLKSFRQFRVQDLYGKKGFGCKHKALLIDIDEDSLILMGIFTSMTESLHTLHDLTHWSMFCIHTTTTWKFPRDVKSNFKPQAFTAIFLKQFNIVAYQVQHHPL